MNIEKLATILSTLSELSDKDETSATDYSQDQAFIGKHVIVRCRDAGVHAGILRSYKDRQCTLIKSRRLWYWKNTENNMYLSGIANHGLHKDSKISEEVDIIMLTENCEILPTSKKSQQSIELFPVATKNA